MLHQVRAFGVPYAHKSRRLQLLQQLQRRIPVGHRAQAALVAAQALQEALNRKGFAAGTPDGVMGPATRAGLRGYQRSLGTVADGYPTLELLQKLQAP